MTESTQIAPAQDSPLGSVNNANSPPAATSASPGAGAASQGTSIYVGDLDPNVSEAALFEHFQSIGAIVSVRICRDAITRRSLGYGYVNFVSSKDAEKAIKVKNYSKLGNLSIRVMHINRDPTTRKNSSGNVFIKNLSSEFTTQTLHDTFLAIGAITSCKVVVDEKGKCRGYGYVHFSSEEDAKHAIQLYNGKKMGGAELYVAPFLRRNMRIEAMILSFTNVYIKNIVPSATDADIKKFFAKFGSVTSTCIKKDKQGRIFGFCNFTTHTEAVKAIEELHEKHVDGLVPDDADTKLYVQRAQKKNERLQELRSKYEQCRYVGLGSGNNLYVKNFGHMTTAQLREIFAEYGDISSVYFAMDEDGQPRGYGFVSFATPEAASRALRELNGRVIDDRPLYVNIAQRKDARRNMLQMQFMRRLMAPWGVGGGGQGRGAGIPLPIYQAMMMMNALTSGHMGANSHFASQQHPFSPPQAGPWMSNTGFFGGPFVNGPAPRHHQHHRGPQPPPSRLHHHKHAHQAISSQAANVAPGTSSGASYASAASRSANAANTSSGSGNVSSQRPIKSGPNTPAGGPAGGLTRRPASGGAPVTPGSSRIGPNRATPISLPVTPNLGPISWDDLKKMSVEEQFNAVGERLYVKIAEIHPEQAPKITGMLLEMDIADLYVMLNQPAELKARVKEAHDVLVEYQKEQPLNG